MNLGKNDWRQVWSSRSPAEVNGSVLAGLLESDGYDSPRARMAEADWRAHIVGWAGLLGLTPASSVFEVGCGAGAALYVLASMGMHVSGIDLAPSLVERAAKSIPAGDFAVGDALDVPAEPQVNACLAVGVFLYFPSLDYAAEVVSRMATKSRRAVAVLDLPDQATKDETSASARRWPVVRPPTRSTTPAWTTSTSTAWRLSRSCVTAGWSESKAPTRHSPATRTPASASTAGDSSPTSD